MNTGLESNSSKLIISIYDYTGAWPSPYIEAGYPVMLWDKKIEGDILEHFSWLCIQIDEAIKNGYIPYGLLSAAPCDDFAASGARWWYNKDKIKPGYEPFENSVEMYIALAEVTFLVKQYCPTFKFWVLENPVGRIEKLVPDLKPFRKMLFNPFDYGDPYPKKTILWGEFNHNLNKKIVPATDSRIHHAVGWDKAIQKTIRSTTPQGFAKAFFEANR